MRYISPGDHAAERAVVKFHPSQHQHHVHPVTAPLYVITAITNPQRFYSRYRLYRRFQKMVEDAGGILVTVELALRDRHHEITAAPEVDACEAGACDRCAGRKRIDIQLKSPTELWHKENLLNLAIRALPADWQYVAWVDADIEFCRPDWVVETVHQLQHFHVIQMWSHAQDLGPDPNYPGNLWYPIGKLFQSFLYSYNLGLKRNPCWGQEGYGGSYNPGADGHLWHSGFAWAARRSALSDLHGLGDIAILGSGDHHMAAALVGQVDQTIHRHMLPNYSAYWHRWQDRALEKIKKNVGVMPGLIYHQWHGKKADRRYMDRWKILVENRYDWETDIGYDVQGLLQFTGNKPALRDAIRSYFRLRNEDTIE